MIFFVARCPIELTGCISYDFMLTTLVTVLSICLATLISFIFSFSTTISSRVVSWDLLFLYKDFLFVLNFSWTSWSDMDCLEISSSRKGTMCIRPLDSMQVANLFQYLSWGMFAIWILSKLVEFEYFCFDLSLLNTFDLVISNLKWKNRPRCFLLLGHSYSKACEICVICNF